MTRDAVAVWRALRLEYAAHVVECDDPACEAEAVFLAVLSGAYLDVVTPPPPAAVGEA